MSFNDVLDVQFSTWVADTMQTCDSLLKRGADPQGPIDIRIGQLFDLTQSWIMCHRELCEMERKQEQACAAAAMEQAFFPVITAKVGEPFTMHEGQTVMLTVKEKGTLIDEEDAAFVTRRGLVSVRK